MMEYSSFTIDSSFEAQPVSIVQHNIAPISISFFIVFFFFIVFSFLRSLYSVVGGRKRGRDLLPDSE